MVVELEVPKIGLDILKVEGAKTNTPPKTNTYKRLPIANTLIPWTIPHEKECPSLQSDRFRSISGIISY